MGVPCKEVGLMKVVGIVVLPATLGDRELPGCGWQGTRDFVAVPIPDDEDEAFVPIRPSVVDAETGQVKPAGSSFRDFEFTFTRSSRNILRANYRSGVSVFLEFTPTRVAARTSQSVLGVHGDDFQNRRREPVDDLPISFHSLLRISPVQYRFEPAAKFPFVPCRFESIMDSRFERQQDPFTLPEVADDLAVEAVTESKMGPASCRKRERDNIDRTESAIGAESQLLPQRDPRQVFGCIMNMTQLQAHAGEAVRSTVHRGFDAMAFEALFFPLRSTSSEDADAQEGLTGLQHGFSGIQSVRQHLVVQG